MQQWCICAELGDISPPPPFSPSLPHIQLRRGDMLTGFLLETIISAGSIVRPALWLAECTASVGGLGWIMLVGEKGGGRGYVWTAALRQVRATLAAKENDRMLRQTLGSSLALGCSL